MTLNVLHGYAVHRSNHVAYAKTRADLAASDFPGYQYARLKPWRWAFWARPLAQSDGNDAQRFHDTFLYVDLLQGVFTNHCVPAERLLLLAMVADSTPQLYLEHLKRLVASGIQPYFVPAHIHQWEIIECLIRSGFYKGSVPLLLVIRPRW